MAEPTYHLVFRGEVLDDQPPATVCKRLAALLKMSPEKARQLFTGRPVVLKRNVPKSVAAKYQAAFRKAGARLRVQPVEQAPAQPTGTGDREGKPEPAAGQAAPAKKMTLAERLAAEAPAGADEQEAGQPSGQTGAPAGERPPPPPPPSATVDASGVPDRPAAAAVPDDAPGADAFSLSAEGGDLVGADELPRSEPVEVDVSHLSAAPPDEGGLEDLSRRPPPPPPPDTSMLSLDAPGVDLTEVRQVDVPDLDLSAFTLAEPGAELGSGERAPPPPAPDPDFSLARPGADLGPEEREAPPPPPDTDHLSLER